MTDLWILNHYAAPPDAGAGTRHHDLAAELADRGIRTTIFASAFSHFTGRHRLGRRDLIRRERFGRVLFVWLRTVSYRGNSWRRTANMVSYLVMVLAAQALFRRPDVVIGSSVHPLAALAGYLVARVRAARFLYEVRDLWPQTLIDIGALSPRSAQARLLRRLEAFLVHHAERVITVLPEMPRYLAEQGLPTSHVVYIPNGVNRAEPPAGLGSLPDEVRRPLEAWRAEGRFIAIYAGSHGLVNGLDVLLDAASLLGEDERIQLVLAGDGPNKAALVDRSRDLGLRNVAFLEPVAKSSVQAMLSLADATIFHLADAPVFSYGISSNKLFDYLASGRPVVFACHSSNNPVSDADAGRCVRPQDPAALAHALRELAATDPSVRAAMGQRGRRYVEEHHSIQALAERLAGVVLGNGDGPRGSVSSE